MPRANVAFGFRAIEDIDEDLGRSAMGLVARPRFERLVAGLVPEKSARCSASTHPALRAMSATGTTRAAR